MRKILHLPISDQAAQLSAIMGSISTILDGQVAHLPCDVSIISWFCIGESVSFGAVKKEK